MKQIKIFSLLAALLLTTAVAQGQDKVMRVHSGGNVVYAANTSQVDSITFKKSCENIDPLTDLPWLKDKIDELTLLFQGNPTRVFVYQCLYGDGETGFLEDRGNVAFFYSCEGEMLCIMGGFTGSTCPEFNIDHESKTLIWDSKEVVAPCEFNNPLTDLSWLKAYIKDFEKYVEEGTMQHVRIYQCSYKYGTGFLFELHAENPKFGYMLRSCAGTPFCAEYSTTDSCEEYDVDYGSKKLIWEIKK